MAYRRFGKKSQVTERYGEEYMEVSAKSSRKWALELTEVVTDNKEQKLSLWVVPAPFCATQYISDP